MKKSWIVCFLGLFAIAVAQADDLGYSPDGGLVSFGEFDYVYDSARKTYIRLAATIAVTSRSLSSMLHRGDL